MKNLKQSTDAATKTSGKEGDRACDITGTPGEESAPAHTVTEAPDEESAPAHTVTEAPSEESDRACAVTATPDGKSAHARAATETSGEGISRVHAVISDEAPTQKLKEYHDIYDRVAKRCVSLSARTTILLINGIYGTNYPPDSSVAYNWTENTDDRLKRTLADTIITINGKFSYHIEFQMGKDGSIVMRCFEYGFYHAYKHRESEDTLDFPDPVIIYLYKGEDAPDGQVLTVRFGNQGTFEYRVPTIKYLELSAQELEKRKLIVLIPFQLLKLRDVIAKARTKENLEALKTLVGNDIIEAIEVNIKAGNISENDGRKLKSLTLQLYHHIYDGYEELETEGVNEAVEEALILDIDIIEDRHQKELNEKEKALEEKERELEEQRREYQRELSDKQAELSDRQAELTALKLLLKGEDAKRISQLTGLTPAQIKHLAET